MSATMLTLLLQLPSSVPRPTVMPAACISAIGAIPEASSRLLTGLLATLTSKARSVRMSLTSVCTQWPASTSGPRKPIEPRYSTLGSPPWRRSSGDSARWRVTMVPKRLARSRAPSRPSRVQNRATPGDGHTLDAAVRAVVVAAHEPLDRGQRLGGRLQAAGIVADARLLGLHGLDDGHEVVGRVVVEHAREHHPQAGVAVDADGGVGGHVPALGGELDVVDEGGDAGAQRLQAVQPGRHLDVLAP